MLTYDETLDGFVGDDDDDDVDEKVINIDDLGYCSVHQLWRLRG